MLHTKGVIIPDRRLVTAEITYRLPDHPDLLQVFIWQKTDDLPDFPRLHEFLEFWSRNIEGRLHGISVRYSGRPWPQWRYLGSGHDLRLN